jgi:ribosomal protein L37E
MTTNTSTDLICEECGIRGAHENLGLCWVCFYGVDDA